MRAFQAPPLYHLPCPSAKPDQLGAWEAVLPSYRSGFGQSQTDRHILVQFELKTLLSGLLNAPLLPAPQIRQVSRRHCALYKFTYLLKRHISD